VSGDFGARGVRRNRKNGTGRPFAMRASVRGGILARGALNLAALLFGIRADHPTLMHHDRYVDVPTAVLFPCRSLPSTTPRTDGWNRWTIPTTINGVVCNWCALRSGAKMAGSTMLRTAPDRFGGITSQTSQRLICFAGLTAHSVHKAVLLRSVRTCERNLSL
jgi:hypothetical protein